MDINFEKYSDGLAPAIVQDADTGKVLMLGYMNAEALALTESSDKIVFYSRSRQRLWTKGETSGNFLLPRAMMVDCDLDAILIKAEPAGPVCHTGADTCFNEVNNGSNFLHELENVIRERRQHPAESSYTSKLFSRGTNKIAQKLGEEAVELVIEAVSKSPERVREEAADVLYHFLVLLADADVRLDDVLERLKGRRKQ